MKLLIIGAGYTGGVIARRVSREAGWQVCGTRRNTEALEVLRQAGVEACAFDASDGVSADLRKRLNQTTHLLICAAPERHAPLRDPAFDALAPLLRADHTPSLRWIGYLSSIGVYGDHDGRWVDEEAACHSRQTRSVMRLAAEKQWQSLASERHLPLSVLRLSGIYGPGRNALEQARAGKARVLIKPGQVFNRIHVDDIAEAAWLCLSQQVDAVLNISDDEPAPPQNVVRHAHALLNLAPPPAVDFDDAELSPMARSFYGENKRVDNRRSKIRLGLRYRYPDYRQGLAALLPLD